MKEVKLTCDIEDMEHGGEVQEKAITAIFDYDQNDARSKEKPHFSEVKLDICDSCLKYILENRRYIYAYGAMGYNKYYLKK